MANLIQDDPDDAVTTHPASGSQPATRNDKRGLLHMLHDEIGKAIGVGTPKELREGENGDTVMGAVNKAVGEASNADPDNP